MQLSLIQELDSLYDLHVNMGNSKKDLLEFISYFYDERSDEYWDADFLIRSEEDLNKWLEIYDSNPDEMERTNTYLRRWKMDERKYCFDEFKDLFELDFEDWLITIFQQNYINRWEIEVNNALGIGLSLELLWERHLDNKYSRVEYLLGV